MARLFEAYRSFYRERPDPALARRFLAARFKHRESMVFIAERRSGRRWDAVGFVQLYPLFSSLRCTRTWVLYDLFVSPGARRRGAGRLLMEAAHRFAKAAGADAVELSTAKTNRKARRLYESMGYARDTKFLHYERRL